MLHYLPDSLYVRNRLTQSGDLEFWLTPTEKQPLQQIARSHFHDPQPVCPPQHEQDPFLALPWAYAQLQWLTDRLLDHDDSEQQLRALAGSLRRLANHTPEATLAAGLLLPYAHYAHAHAVHVALLVARLTQRLALAEAECESLVCAALTMNIAMVNLQQQLSHQAEALSSLQAKQLRLHPLTSSALLREVGIADETWHLAILEHHELWNGKGYPFGLPRNKISPGAHLLHVADVAMARLHPRHYRRSQLPKNAMVQLFKQRDTLADARLTDCLIKEIGLYPPGSFVKLEQGDTAIVVQHGDDITTPLTVRFGRDASIVPTASRIASPAQMTVEARHLPALARLWQCRIDSPVG